MSETSVFDVPELVGLIAQYLDHTDLLHCTLASKAMDGRFRSHLWQDFSVRVFCCLQGYPSILKRTRGETAEGIRRNRHLVRTIDIGMFANDYLSLFVDDSPAAPEASGAVEPSTSLSIPSSSSVRHQSVTRLRSIKLKLEQTEEARDRICPIEPALTLLSANPFLTELCIPAQFLNNSTSTDRFLTLLDTQLPQLERLDFFTVYKAEVDFQKAMRLMEVCCHHGHLKVLEAGFGMSFSPEKDSHFLRKELPRMLTYPSRTIRSLKHPVTSDHQCYVWPFLLPFLKGCVPNLERFYLNHWLTLSEGEAVLKALVENCPRLEHLSGLISFQGQASLHNLINFIRTMGRRREESWPLQMEHEPGGGGGGGGRRGGTNVEAGTRSKEALKGVGGGGEGEARMPARGLKSIRIQSFQSHPQLIAAILENASTLEEIVLDNADYVLSSHVQILLTRFPELRKISVMGLHGLTEPGYALQFREILGSRWVCTRLKKLELVLGRELGTPPPPVLMTPLVAQNQVEQGQGGADLNEPTVIAMHGSELLLEGDSEAEDEDGMEEEEEEDEEGEEAWAEEDEEDGYCTVDEEGITDEDLEDAFFEMTKEGPDAQASRRVYAQIGRLVELEELVLGFEYFGKASQRRLQRRYKHDLTMHVGLPFLGGLEKLRRIHLLSDMWSRMGMGEVEFMVEHWPRLEMIRLDIFREDEFRELMAKECWRWLKKRRPLIQVLFSFDEKELASFGREFEMT